MIYSNTNTTTNQTNNNIKKINKISTLTKLQTLYKLGQIDFKYNRITESELSEIQLNLEYYLTNGIEREIKTEDNRDYKINYSNVVCEEDLLDELIDDLDPNSFQVISVELSKENVEKLNSIEGTNYDWKNPEEILNWYFDGSLVSCNYNVQYMN